MLKNKQNFYLIGVSLIFLMVVTSSCKSHKSHDTTDFDDVLTVKHYKKKELSSREKIIKEAKEWLGTPYKYGHMEKGLASDCSGMVMVVFVDATGIKLPRNSGKQAEFCFLLKKEDILPGDLVFFATGKDKTKVTHVGIMIDSETFIHASSSKGVTISKMTTPYYQRTFLRYGRVPQLD